MSYFISKVSKSRASRQEPRRHGFCCAVLLFAIASKVCYRKGARNQLCCKTKKLGKKQSGSKSPAGASIVPMDSAANGQHRDYTYDDQGRLTQLSNGSIATFSYGYDNPLLGQRTSMTSALGTTNYSYDSNYQLTQANYPNVLPFNGEVHSWSYDNIGNRLSNTVNGVPANYTYYKNGSNQLNGQRLQSDGVKTYTYDNNGNMTGDGTNTCTWDYENRLTGITGPGLTASYSYDYLGRRASKTVNGVTTTYLYDGQNLIRESGTTTADYVFGPGIDEPLAASRSGLVSYYNVDGLGSVASLSDSAGVLQNSYDYDAWGVLRNQSGSVQNSFLYTARENAEAGLYFYRARYYQPSAGRFVSEDPIGFDRNDLQQILRLNFSFYLMLPKIFTP